ncbi:uncharacterized protein EV422DRAFT_605445 [Fimicolochytrium jonesii]|uniref:uncharacterized protein n=1 Tax=Fimicolochytrium jonesii TaxID=1396493 RepID=UPI0022FDC57C|nr:uncharacterized protein EV422DRAFT_605445 [Fimicolochytrium jonesii]KAI8824986.1 hypothetical protein EV422DRAFT_605445 [Fimicolochytrium jonesii]
MLRALGKAFGSQTSLSSTSSGSSSQQQQNSQQRKPHMGGAHPATRKSGPASSADAEPEASAKVRTDSTSSASSCPPPSSSSSSSSLFSSSSTSSLGRKPSGILRRTNSHRVLDVSAHRRGARLHHSDKENVNVHARPQADNMQGRDAPAVTGVYPHRRLPSHPNRRGVSGSAHAHAHGYDPASNTPVSPMPPPRNRPHAQQHIYQQQHPVQQKYDPVNYPVPPPPPQLQYQRRHVSDSHHPQQHHSTCPSPHHPYAFPSQQQTSTPQQPPPQPLRTLHSNPSLASLAPSESMSVAGTVNVRRRPSETRIGDFDFEDFECGEEGYEDEERKKSGFGALRRRASSVRISVRRRFSTKRSAFDAALTHGSSTVHLPSVVNANKANTTSRRRASMSASTSRKYATFTYGSALAARSCVELGRVREEESGSDASSYQRGHPKVLRPCASTTSLHSLSHPVTTTPAVTASLPRRSRSLSLRVRRTVSTPALASTPATSHTKSKSKHNENIQPTPLQLLWHGMHHPTPTSSATSYTLGTALLARDQVALAVPHLHAAAAKGHADAAYTLAVLWMRGWSGEAKGDGGEVEPDHGRAMQYYLSAARLGHAAAMCNVGVMYAAGMGVASGDADGVPSDNDEEVYEDEQEEEEDSHGGPSMSRGRQQQRGHGRGRGRRTSSTSASGSSSSSQSEGGNISPPPKPRQPNHILALSYLRQSALAGYPKGMYNLAAMLYGNGDFIGAAAWFERAARAGCGGDAEDWVRRLRGGMRVGRPLPAVPGGVVAGR